MTGTIFNFTAVVLVSLYVGVLIGVMMARELFDLHPGNKLRRR